MGTALLGADVPPSIPDGVGASLMGVGSKVNVKTGGKVVGDTVVDSVVGRILSSSIPKNRSKNGSGGIVGGFLGTATSGSITGGCVIGLAVGTAVGTLSIKHVIDLAKLKLPLPEQITTSDDCGALIHSSPVIVLPWHNRNRD